MTSENDPSGAERQEAHERALGKAEREIYTHVQELHDKGVIDLDAPARAVIDVLDKEFPTPSADAAAARAGGYWLVGDQGWCNHLN